MLATLLIALAGVRTLKLSSEPGQELQEADHQHSLTQSKFTSVGVLDSIQASQEFLHTPGLSRQLQQADQQPSAAPGAGPLLEDYNPQTPPAEAPNAPPPYSYDYSVPPGASFGSPPPVGFPPPSFVDDLLSNVDKEATCESLDELGQNQFLSKFLTVLKEISSSFGEVLLTTKAAATVLVPGPAELDNVVKQLFTESNYSTDSALLILRQVAQLHIIPKISLLASDITDKEKSYDTLLSAVPEKDRTLCGKPLSREQSQLKLVRKGEELQVKLGSLQGRLHLAPTSSSSSQQDAGEQANKAEKVCPLVVYYLQDLLLSPCPNTLPAKIPPPYPPPAVAPSPSPTQLSPPSQVSVSKLEAQEPVEPSEAAQSNTATSEPQGNSGAGMLAGGVVAVLGLIGALVLW